MPRHCRQLSHKGIYHVMVRGIEKSDIFHNDDDKLKFLDILEKKKSENEFDLFAFCLMDNHVHLLLKEKEFSLSRIMKCINVSYALYFNKTYSRVGYLFQDRFKSEIINNEAYLLEVIRYIHNNHVKAGMVKNSTDYHCSSYNFYITNEDSALVNKELILSIFSNKPEEGINSFIQFSIAKSGMNFLDLAEDISREENENIDYAINEFVQKNLVKLNDIQGKVNKKHALLRNILVRELRRNEISDRRIAKVLGIGKSTVNRTK